MPLKPTLLLLVPLLITGCARNPEQAAWPTCEELSRSAEYLNPPRYEKGAFVAADGHRTFLIGAYGRDDPRFDLYGKRELGELPPNSGLYDPQLHGWIYEQPLNWGSATRLGFNFYSMSLNPKPFYETVGYEARVPEDPDYVATFARELRLLWLDEMELAISEGYGDYVQKSFLHMQEEQATLPWWNWEPDEFARVERLHNWVRRSLPPAKPGDAEAAPETP